MTSTGPLLTPADIAAELSVTTGHLAQMRYLGTGPRYVKVSGRKVRYRRDDVDKWLEARSHTSTSDAGRVGA